MQQHIYEHTAEVELVTHASMPTLSLAVMLPSSFGPFSSAAWPLTLGGIASVYKPSTRVLLSCFELWLLLAVHAIQIEATKAQILAQSMKIIAGWK